MSESYCQLVRSGGLHPVHPPYHDLEYGFPLQHDHELFERLVLEINQAGLSWETILKKRDGFRAAYAGFSLERVATFDKGDFERLMQDSSIIRNRLKIQAAIGNAQKILHIQARHGSFSKWLEEHHPLPLEGWVKLFKSEFSFTGGEIVREFLTSTGFLSGAHDPGCPCHAQILALEPAWAREK